ncbi:MAG: multiprotein bridging factor aMBF1 [Methanobrevibacter sp.]|jgi:putative transcription factor|nr:multiprotein bridging factor aMBF1 [Candidatus Methanovirga meridionalis]
MRCEICGEIIKDDEPIKIKIDGSIMDVCTNCTKFGKVQKTIPTPKVVIKKSQTANINKKTNKNINLKKSNSIANDEPKDELVEEYNIIIKNKREFQGLSRDELSSKINEKASVIARVESGKMIPDIKLARKFEKALKITLIEAIGKFDLKESLKADDIKPTLGDIVKIKK